MVKDANKEKVAEISAKLKASKSLFLFDYQGINVGKLTKFRAEMKEIKSEVKVYKNTLLYFALKDAGVSVADELNKLLVNSTALVLVNEDSVETAKRLTAFAKENENLKVKGGLMEGRVVSAADVKIIATLPSREVLLSKVLMLFNSPASGFVNVLAGNIRNFVGVLNSVKDKKAL